MSAAELAAAAVVWLCLAVCAGVYFGYPALLLLLARLRPRPVRRRAPGEEPRSATLVIPVHNEEAVIAEKLANSLALRYPAEKLDVLVVSDGSTDATDAIVRREAARAGGRVRLLPLARCGKAAALDEGARSARGELLVLSDANAQLEPESLEWLTAPFADPEVGGVCGRKRHRRRGTEAADATAEGESLYWRWEQWQKALESRIGSVYAADGTLYALRRTLYVPIADPAQADDIAVSARVVLQGYRLLFEPRAVAWEEPPAEGREELRRKVRVTNHSVRALRNLGPALWTSGFYSLELLAHKLLRHLVPFFLPPLLLASAALAPRAPLYAALFAAQLLFYVLAAAGFLLRGARLGRAAPLAVPYYFCLVNAAAFLGVLSILRGRRLQAWTPRGGLEPERAEQGVER
ncbi:MAG TPA: glycosyltransferase family 2 protein [Thermoanaerobaculia bacterium]|nr:glycosyltransferase family 2 protein [Thermoanaerobaculia bacterium]